MPRILLTVPFADDLLARVADELLASLPGAADGDLSDALVLLPSARVGRDLEHRLLERSGRPALLLPRLITDTQWADELAAGLGLDDADLPDDRLRALLLARRLAGADWLEGGAAAAPGLAAAFLDFFDEVRRHRLDQRVLRAGDPTPLVQLARTADAEVVAREVARIREVWALYRRDLPRDRLDRLVEVADALERGEGLPPARPALVVVAGFGAIDPLRAVVLNAALDLGQDHRLVVPAAEADLDRRLQATWGAAEAAVDPLAPTRRLLEALGAPTGEPTANDPPLGARLRELIAAGVGLPTVPPRLLEAENPELEAVAVAALVAAHLQEHGAPPLGVTIGTNDAALAARIVARLRDAGLDADNTVGEPLGALPAGLLLRFMLRAALTDLRAEPLLEVLSHPYTRLTVGGAGTGTWALRFEQMVRRETGPQAGLAGLHRRAQDRDAATLALFQRQLPGMEQFVSRVAEAFAPLLAVADGRARPWAELLEATAATWALLAPERPLAENPEWADVTALARLLTLLRADAERLPRTDLAGFAADLGRLLTAESVVPHRPRGIPVVVTGLVEARLARSDLLILAGLNDGVFPAAAATQVVLPGRVRRLLGLPTWREARARDAELFLRLLHGAPIVAVTWSRWREQQPALPSPLVARLQLALDNAEAEPAPTVPWRSEAPPLAEIDAAQAAFTAEPLPIARHAEARPLAALSWSALARWRDCPYRVLLERGFALQADEEVREEFGRKEYGSVVHAVMCEALGEGAPCRIALGDGQAGAAAAALTEVARRHFLPGAAELPERRLWLDAFLKQVPGLIAVEIDRFLSWRPAALEAAFTFPLAELQAWTTAMAAAAGQELPPPLPDHAAGVTLRGIIDRIDRSLLVEHELAVIDYKTGGAPVFKDLTELEDLQLALYALALELGAVPSAKGTPTSAVFYGMSDDACGPLVPKGKPHPLQREPGEAGLLLDAARELLRLAAAASDLNAPLPLLPRAVDPQQHTRGSLPCAWCDHRGVCRVEERPMPPSVIAGLDKVVNAREVGR